MKFTTMTLGLAACVSAAAVSLPDPEGDWKLLLRQDDDPWNYVGDGEWDVRVYYGGGEFNWGELPPWSALDTAGQDSHCDGGGCNSEWDVDTRRIVDDGDQTQSIQGMKISAQAFYDDWARNGIIETLKHLSSMTYRVEHDRYAQFYPPCDISNPDCLQESEGPMDQYYAPKRFNIIMTHDDGRDYNMRLEALEDADEDVDICGPITGGAAAVAGVINPWLGGGVGILALACLAE